MKTEHWAYIGIGLTCLFFLAICSGSDDVDETEYEEYSEYEQTYSSDSADDAIPSWVQGRWYCAYTAQGMPYCPDVVDISGGYISEYYEDECYEGTYYVDDNRILGKNVVSNKGKAGVNVVYYIDFDRKKLYKNIMGTACYYNKR